MIIVITVLAMLSPPCPISNAWLPIEFCWICEYHKRSVHVKSALKAKERWCCDLQCNMYVCMVGCMMVFFFFAFDFVCYVFYNTMNVYYFYLHVTILVNVSELRMTVMCVCVCRGVLLFRWSYYHGIWMELSNEMLMKIWTWNCSTLWKEHWMNI